MAIITGDRRPSSGGGGGGGGVTQTLSNITGLLATTKGGTGLNASDLNDLRNKLGINDTGQSDTTLLYAPHADLQPNNSIRRVDGSTTNRPTNVVDGIIVRIGNDQFCIDLESGRQWKRTLTDNNDGLWTTPSTNTPGPLAIASEFVLLGEDGHGVITADQWKPSYTNGDKPAKVIVARNGNYLVAIDRYNMWWAPRITSNAATSIAWKWAATSQVPAGLAYAGGEKAEELIPVNDSGVLLGQSGIDGENVVDVLVVHTISAGTSTYNGYFLDNDGTTVKNARNTRGSNAGDWARVQLDEGGIDDTIISADRGSGHPVFHGIIPAIDDLHFPGYTSRTNLTEMTRGSVFYDAATRRLYVIHKTEDTHLTDLFAADFEVEIEGISPYSFSLRGVFDSVYNVSGGSLTAAVFRSEDLNITGTWTANQTVDLKGHKSVITKTDRILPVNLGLAHGATEANKLVTMNEDGDLLTLSTSAPIANDSITGAKIADKTIPFTKMLPLYDEKTGYSFTDNNSFTGGTPIAQGKINLVDNGGTHQAKIYLNTGDVSWTSDLASGLVFILWQSPTVYWIGKQSGAVSAEESGTDHNLKLTINVDHIENRGTLADGAATTIYYGDSNQPDSVHKVSVTGGVAVGHLEPGSMGISPGSSIAGHLVSFDSAGTGFGHTNPAHTGLVKEILVMRSNTGSSGDGVTIDNVGNARKTWTNSQNMQTGGWTLANKATDWLRVNAAGLYYFGNITAQPIVANLELWVRWKGAGETYQNWGTTDGQPAEQARVKIVPLGGDYLQRTKLFAGGLGTNQSHVDCAVPSGTKFLKLSQLHTDLSDGDELQFTVGFSNENTGPAFRVRNFFMTCEIVDGSKVHANY